MKKVLLAGTALLGLAVVATPAQADIDLELGGYFAGYGVFTDNDETGTVAAGDELRRFELRRDNEFYISGETTTDHGLTVGVHSEARVGNGGGATAPLTAGAAGSLIDETYLYFSGGWGRVNLGTEDGAAYLLQVAAPSADSNVDGLRTYITALNSDVWNDNTLDGDYAGALLDYQHADFRQTDRLTYLTPKFNGFQAGVSYAPEPVFYGPGEGVAPALTDDVAGAFENLWEASARWDGEFQGFGVSLGGGYSHASTEINAAAGGAGSDDLVTWNAGLNVAFSGFSVGGAYHTTNNGITPTGAAGSTEEDTRTWVVGGAWDNGPYHVGVSYLDREYGDATSAALASDLEVRRVTLGGGYTFGPGMSFRGAVAVGEADANTAAVRDTDFTQVTVGTDIQF